MKVLAYRERLNIKEVCEEAIKDRIAKYEKKNGALKAGAEEIRLLKNGLVK